MTAAVILAAVHRGDLDTARAEFIRIAAGDHARARDLIHRLADLVPIPPGAVLLGPSPRVWGNPFRPGWAWRCGPCDPDTWTGGPEPAARRTAARHLTKVHPAGDVVITECDPDGNFVI